MNVRNPREVRMIAPGCRRGGLWSALALAVSAGLSACASSSLPRLEDPRSLELARAATAGARWQEASRRWGSIFVDQGGVEACAETARALLELGDARRAHDVLALGLERDPEAVPLLELDGRALAQSGYRRAAESTYERALALEPDHLPILVALARLRLELGLEQAAIVPLERARVLAPDDVELTKLYAEVAQRAGKGERAYRAWSQVLGRADANASELVRAATLWKDPAVRESFEDASDVCLAWLNRAIALDPQCSDAHFQIGLIAEARGERDRAVEAYRRAVELEPTSLCALTNLAILYARIHDEQGVREMVARALELEDDPLRRAQLERLLEPFDM